MISFNTPCLKWKFAAARKLQSGWPGFLAPYQTRYLNKHVVITTVPTYGYGTPEQAPGTVRTQDFYMDRFGNITIDPNPADADANFIYGQPLGEDPVHNESWTVTETYFKHVYNDGYTYQTTEVTLSNEYTPAQLNADLDGLIGAIDLDALPWNEIEINVAPDIQSGPDPNSLIPAQYSYGDAFHPGWQFPVPLRSAAYSALAGGTVDAVTWFPNAGVKVVGRIAMAGNYCLDTFVVDDNGNLLSATCQSGVGSCAGAFTVNPPPVVLGSAAYILLTPDCQCGE